MALREFRDQFGQPFSVSLSVGDQFATAVGLRGPSVRPLVRIRVEYGHIGTFTGQCSAEADGDQRFAYAALAAGERDDRHVPTRSLWLASLRTWLRLSQYVYAIIRIAVWRKTCAYAVDNYPAHPSFPALQVLSRLAP